MIVLYFVVAALIGLIGLLSFAVAEVVAVAVENAFAVAVAALIGDLEVAEFAFAAVEGLVGGDFVKIVVVAAVSAFAVAVVASVVAVVPVVVAAVATCLVVDLCFASEAFVVVVAVDLM